MANYPTPPGRRIPYDTDGSVVQIKFASIATPLQATGPEMALLNSETDYRWPKSNDGALDEWNDVSILFPELRNLKGVFVSSSTYHGGDRWGAAYTSVDTTNGLDGTWDQVVAQLPDVHGATGYRDNIEIFNAVGVIGLKLQWRRYIGEVGNIHIYGSPNAAATTDRLEFMDPSDDEAFDPLLDYEDLPRGTTTITEMDVKNLSSTLTAVDVDLTVQALTGTSDAWYTFSDDGVTYTASLELGDIVPGADVHVWLKQVIPLTAVLGLESARIRAEPTQWTEA